MKNSAGNGKGQKKKWSPEEEEALRVGVRRYGTGKWRAIQKDPELGGILATRSNVDLKDKWRNIMNNRPKNNSNDFLLEGVPQMPSNKRRRVKEELELSSDEEEDEEIWNSSPGPSTRKLRSSHHNSDDNSIVTYQNINKALHPHEAALRQMSIEAANKAAAAIAHAEYLGRQALIAAKEAEVAEEYAAQMAESMNIRGAIVHAQ